MRGIRGVEMAYAWVGWTLAMTGGQSQISARSEEALALHTAKLGESRHI
jgi:hypothetical protein